MLCCRWSARFSISKPASRSAKEERRGAVDRSPKRGRFAVGGRLNSGVANPPQSAAAWAPRGQDAFFVVN